MRETFSEPSLRETRKLKYWYVKKGLLGRFYIVNQDGLAWSGSQWVEIGGDVQVCNFVTTAAAMDYADQMRQALVQT